jgi:hypothetical protein
MREFYEESLGMLVSDAESLVGQMEHGRCIALRSKTMNGNVYIMFVVVVPFSLSLPHHFKKSVSYLKWRGLHRVLEKQSVEWVRFDRLASLPCRHAFTNTLKLHRSTLSKINSTPLEQWPLLCRQIHPNEEEFNQTIRIDGDKG